VPDSVLLLLRQESPATTAEWWGRLGDISRFEPTKSGANRYYAENPQNIHRQPEEDYESGGT